MPSLTIRNGILRSESWRNTRACPTAGYALCAHVEELRGLTHDELKWGWNSPFKKVGSFDELEPEARIFLLATLVALAVRLCILAAHTKLTGGGEIVDAQRSLLDSNHKQRNVAWRGPSG